MDFNSWNFIELIYYGVTVVYIIVWVLDSHFANYLPNAVLVTVRHGRLNFTKIQANSYINKFQVPKRWFAHFYLFAVIFQSALIYTIQTTYFDKIENEQNWLVQLVSILGGNNRHQTVDAMTTTLVTFLFLLHVSRRLYECWFVSIYSNTKFSVILYLGSYGFYFLTMLSLIAHSPSFCGTPITDNSFNLLDMEWSLFHTAGVSIVSLGFQAQYRAHVGFANLRKGHDKIVSLKHHIPKGGLFDLVCSPNYLAEIVIYVCFAIIFQFQNATWNSVCVCVSVNQVYAGIMNRRWYLATFPKFPKERKAIIPYLL